MIEHETPEMRETVQVKPLNVCTSGEMVQEIENFLKELLPAEEVFTTPTSALTQLENAKAFAETVPHGKFAFHVIDGGFCMRGYLLGGNGIVMKPGINYGFPFSGTAKNGFDQDVHLELFRDADAILDSLMPASEQGGGVMALNDSKWFTKDYALALLDMAIEKAAA